MLIELTAKDYVRSVSSESPTPGGGSVAALAGSLGGALTNMVGNLTIGKKVYDGVPQEQKVNMEEAFQRIDKLIEELILIVDEDSTAFDDVMRAFKLPKETDEEKKLRTSAIQEGYKKAMEVPLRCAEKCLEILRLQDVFANYGNVNAITDVGVGTLLAYTGLEGALFNVIINLKSIKDQEYKAQIEGKLDALMEEGKRLKEEMLAIVYKRLL
ncbi:cyclodeaminase/cyclohydrolase family protein [Gudongella oleilytica]|uniref:cyclodeaminase/cyclohydrolase family protein n=1 Tax=Gudongella oleilytica TaxID=1582259 RepID=UPI000FF87EE8|nr:cyclodeaminase/cyclohydrolase family protein [Gudongella oleilytica]